MTGSVVQPDTGEVTVLMSAEEAEEKTLKAQQYMGMVCHLVKELHDKQAWRALGYPSWVAYCKDRFNVGKSRSYQLIGYAETIALGKAVTGLPESTIVDSLPEGTARGIDRADLAAALTEAFNAIPRDADISTRGELLAAVLDQLTADPAPADESPQIPTSGPEVPAPSAPVSDPSAGQGSPSPDPAPTHPGSPEGDTPDAEVTEQGPDGPAADEDPGEAGAPESRTAAPGDAEGSGTDVAQTGSQEGDGGGPSSDTPVVTPELAAAAERAAVSAEMVAARPLLNRDPADVVALMAPEDAEVWIAHKEDMAEWFHGFDAAMTDRNQLRSVQ